jgi:hypothetical protein
MSSLHFPLRAVAILCKLVIDLMQGVTKRCRLSWLTNRRVARAKSSSNKEKSCIL